MQVRGEPTSEHVPGASRAIFDSLQTLKSSFFFHAFSKRVTDSALHNDEVNPGLSHKLPAAVK